MKDCVFAQLPIKQETDWWLPRQYEGIATMINSQVELLLNKYPKS